jgi:fatty-acyl-CoA synthase
MMLVECVILAETGLPKGVLYSHRSTYLHASTIISPNAGNYNNLDTILLVVPQFHVMVGDRIYVCCLDQTWCYPLLTYSQKLLLKFLEEEKVTKAKVPPFGLGL